MTLTECAGCLQPIFDKFIFTVMEKSWHAGCLQCVDCKCSLTEKCFCRDNRIFCREDFYKRYGKKCSGCGEGIYKDELVRKCDEKIYHLRCFVCIVCRKQMTTGEELYIFENMYFICREDYEKFQVKQGNYNEIKREKTIPSPFDGEYEVYDPPSKSAKSQLDDKLMEDVNTDVLNLEDFGKTRVSPNNEKSEATKMTQALDIVDSANSQDMVSLDNDQDAEFLDESCEDTNYSIDDMNSSILKDSKENTIDQDGIGISQQVSKKRGPRTTIKAKQLEMLKSAFATTPKPTRHIREQLANDTGLNMRVIQVWFQNRRSKERRMRQVTLTSSRRHWGMRNIRRPYEVNEMDVISGTGQLSYMNAPANEGFQPEYYQQRQFNEYIMPENVLHDRISYPHGNSISHSETEDLNLDINFGVHAEILNHVGNRLDENYNTKNLQMNSMGPHPLLEMNENAW